MPRGSRTPSSSSFAPTPPKNWPSDVTYLSRALLSPALSPSQLLALRTRPPDHGLCPGGGVVDLAALLDPASYRAVLAGLPAAAARIQPIAQPAHPARGQRGLFAARALRPGEFVALYRGVVHGGGREPGADGGGEGDGGGRVVKAAAVGNRERPAWDRGHESSDYDLWLDREAGLAVDAALAGSEARFVNDYRGVPLLLHGPAPASVPAPTAPASSSSSAAKAKAKGANSATTARPREKTSNRAGPNAEFREVWMPRSGRAWTGDGERGIAVFVLPEPRKGGRTAAGGKGRGIAKGEEILVSYGKGFWGSRREEMMLGDGGQLHEEDARDAARGDDHVEADFAELAPDNTPAVAVG